MFHPRAVERGSLSEKALRLGLALGAEVINDLRSVLALSDEHAANEQLGRVVRKYQKSAPKLADG
jgi:hypothetical protein